jgi:hypothetical protein
MIARWYKTYIRRFGEGTEKKKVTCNALLPNPRILVAVQVAKIMYTRDLFQTEE